MEDGEVFEAEMEGKRVKKVRCRVLSRILCFGMKLEKILL